jgi:hypothetical protein
MNILAKRSGLAIAIAGICLSAGVSQASSHREAPFITEIPKVDGTDFYMFRSYEGGRDGYVTLIANYLPLQDAYGGPNYFDLDDDAIYEIHIDNDGDAVEDLTFQFSLTNIENPIMLDIGPDGGPKESVAIPLKGATPGLGTTPTTVGDSFQTSQEYEVTVISGDRRTGTPQPTTNVTAGGTKFRKPVDNIGSKTFSDYPAYASTHVYEIDLPNCGSNGQVFVGQRKEAFAVNLGEVFDLVNIPDATATPRVKGLNILDDKNVTSFALEVPTECLTGTAQTEQGDPVIGAWTTASVRQAQVINPSPTAEGKGAAVKGGAHTQVSRLGMPLVNELVIGLVDKDRFNSSEPKDDTQFATYVTNPTLPKLLNVVTDGALAEPQVFPRVDLVATFLSGLTLDLTRAGATGTFSNQPVDVQVSDMLRLNTNVAPANADATTQNDLGLLALEVSGFPNGRRPVDDVVDIALQVTVGEILPFFDDENGNRHENPNPGAGDLNDGAVVDRAALLGGFPYLGHPVAGSPNPQRQP